MSSTINILARFARLLATAPSSSEVQELLVHSAVDVVGADGAVLVLVDATGLPRIVARRSFAAEVTLATDLLGAELVERLLAAEHRFTSASALPLVAAGGLYGVVVLFFTDNKRLNDEELKLAATVVDIVAATLARARELDELEHAYDELQATRRALAQDETLRALGAMAVGVSHDLKNVFAPMLLLLQVIETGTEDGDTVRANVKRMRRPLNNGLALVERLRFFGRPRGDEAREVHQLGTVIADAVGLCRPRLSQAAAHVALAIEGDEAPPVRIEGAEAVAAVANLVVNALDAVSALGGQVTVRSGGRDEGAFVEVTDSGPGVPPEIRERIFEQFFTTKGKSGTGVGLGMVHEFARRHGGTLVLESPLSGGARFTIWLPAARDP